MSKRKNNEQTIDILHLLLSLISHWRSILILALIGAILGAGFSFFKMPVKERYTASGELVSGKIPSLKTDERRAIDVAIDYYTLYADIEKYLNNSILMNSDFADLCQGQIFFTCSDSAMVDETMFATKAFISSEAFIEKIRKNTGIELENQYLTELLSCEKHLAYMNSEEDFVEESTNVFTVSFIYNDKEIVSKATETISKELSTFVNSLSSTNVRVISSGITAVETTTLITRRYNLCNQMSNALTNYKKAAKDFSKNQNVVYTKLLNGQSVEPTVFEEGEIESKRVFDSSVLVKWLFIGLGAFALGYCVIVVIAYIASNKIKTVADVEKATDARVIYVAEENKKKGLDKLLSKQINNIAGNSVSIAYAKKNLSLLTKEKSLILSASDLKDDKDSVKASFASDSDLLEVVTGKLSSDVEAFEKALDVKNIWLLLDLNQTKASELENELAVIEENSLNLSGIIVMGL